MAVNLGTREGLAPEPRRAAGTGRAGSTPSLFGPMGPWARQASVSSSAKWEHYPPHWSTGQGQCSEHSRCAGNRCFSPHGPVELKELWTVIACPSHTQGAGGPEPSCPPRPICYWTPGSRAAFRGMKGSPALHRPCMEPRALFTEQLPRGQELGGPGGGGFCSAEGGVGIRGVSYLDVPMTPGVAGTLLPRVSGPSQGPKGPVASWAHVRTN